MNPHPSVCRRGGGFHLLTKSLETPRGFGSATAEVNPDTGRLLGPLHPIASGFASDDSEIPRVCDIDDIWYLLLAEGGSMALHAATVRHSLSPWGLFEPGHDNPFLAEHNA